MALLVLVIPCSLFANGYPKILPNVHFEHIHVWDQNAKPNEETMTSCSTTERQQQPRTPYYSKQPNQLTFPTTATIMGDDNTAAAASAAAMAAHQQELRKHLEVLDVQRRSLEFESEAIVTELTTSDNTRIPPMGIDTPLVDREGFPRNDIDVLRARTLRGRLMTIRTDHKLLLQQIDAQLAILTAATKAAAAAEGGGGVGSGDDEQHMKEEIEEEMAARSAPKPKPKFDPLTGKWVVRNWDGSMYVLSAKNDEPKVGMRCCSLSLVPPSFCLQFLSLLLFLLLLSLILLISQSRNGAG
jgi:hypothetical protein